MDAATAMGILFVVLFVGHIAMAGKIFSGNPANDSTINCKYHTKTSELKCLGNLHNGMNISGLKSIDFSLAERISLENCQENSMAPIHYFEEIWRDFTIQTEKLSEIRILNCHLFDDLKSSIFDRSLPTLKTFIYAEDCHGKTCTKFCDHALNNDFLANFGRAAPSLEFLTLVNVGLCTNFEHHATEVTTNSSENLRFDGFRSLKTLDLSYNSLTELPRVPASLLTLNISRNHIREFDSRSEPQFALQTLDISGNRFTNINSLIKNIPSLLVLNASNNHLQDFHLSNSSNIQILDISNNRLKFLDGGVTAAFPNLKDFRSSANPITDLSTFAQNQKLESLDLSRTELETLNLEIFGRLSNLRWLSVQNSPSLRFLYDDVTKNLPSLERLLLANCSLKSLPYDIFRHNSKGISIDIRENSWLCDCRLNWLIGLDLSRTKLLDSNQTFCSHPANSVKNLLTNFLLTLNETSCDFGSTAENGAIIRAQYGEDCLLDCGFYSRQPVRIDWYKLNSEKTFNFDELVSNEKYVNYADGTLRIRNVSKWDVAVYACVAFNNGTGENITIFQRFRLDYATSWWLLKIYSIACGILLAMAFFALNAISGAIRRLIAWRVSNIERKGRVRLMLQSMEKYRTRQMMHFQEMYTYNVNQIRDNYHQQVEALRKSYASQAERFRDYKNVQLETVAGHVDFLRDNYNAQMGRIRDYGGKRMERVWLSYQRRVSGLRDYTLQHRSRLMTRYKLKQGYFNKLLESLGANWSTTGRAAPPPELIEMRTLADFTSPSTSVADGIESPQGNRFSVEMRMIIQESLLSSKKLKRHLSTDLATEEVPGDDDYQSMDEALQGRRHCSSEPSSPQSEAAGNWDRLDPVAVPDSDCDEDSLHSCDTYHSVTSVDFVFADKMQK